jgi:uncharacterized protein
MPMPAPAVMQPVPVTRPDVLTIKSSRGLVQQNSFNHPDVELLRKPSGELGVFAKTPIGKGEIATIFVGDFVTGGELSRLHPQIQKQSLQVADDVFQVATKHPERHPNAFDLAENYNHSCNPNLFLVGNNVLITARDIQAGEELRFDYGTTDGVANPDRGWQCDCGGATCRKQTSPMDYLKLIPKYGVQHVSQYLARKFKEGSQPSNLQSSLQPTLAPQPWPLSYTAPVQPAPYYAGSGQNNPFVLPGFQAN